MEALKKHYSSVQSMNSFLRGWLPVASYAKARSEWNCQSADVVYDLSSLVICEGMNEWLDSIPVWCDDSYAECRMSWSEVLLHVQTKRVGVVGNTANVDSTQTSTPDTEQRLCYRGISFFKDCKAWSKMYLFIGTDLMLYIALRCSIFYRAEGSLFIQLTGVPFPNVVRDRCTAGDDGQCDNGHLRPTLSAGNRETKCLFRDESLVKSKSAPNERISEHKDQCAVSDGADIVRESRESLLQSPVCKKRKVDRSAALFDSSIVDRRRCACLFQRGHFNLKHSKLHHAENCGQRVAPTSPHNTLTCKSSSVGEIDSNDLSVENTASSFELVSVDSAVKGRSVLRTPLVRCGEPLSVPGVDHSLNNSASTEPGNCDSFEMITDAVVDLNSSSINGYVQTTNFKKRTFTQIASDGSDKGEILVESKFSAISQKAVKNDRSTVGGHKRTRRGKRAGKRHPATFSDDLALETGDKSSVSNHSVLNNYLKLSESAPVEGDVEYDKKELRRTDVIATARLLQRLESSVIPNGITFYTTRFDERWPDGDAFTSAATSSKANSDGANNRSVTTVAAKVIASILSHSAVASAEDRLPPSTDDRSIRQLTPIIEKLVASHRATSFRHMLNSFRNVKVVSAASREINDASEDVNQQCEPNLNAGGGEPVCVLKENKTKRKKSHRDGNGGILTKLASETNSPMPLSTVYQFVRIVCLRVLSRELLGSRRNHRRFFAAIKRLIFAGRYQILRLSDFTKDLVVKDCSWIPAADRTGDSSGNHRLLLSRVIHWLVVGYLLPLIRSQFYVTETSSSRFRMQYYPVTVWSTLHEAAVERYADEKCSLLNDDTGTTTALARVSIGRLRFIQKRDSSLRPVTTLNDHRLTTADHDDEPIYTETQLKHARLLLQAFCSRYEDSCRHNRLDLHMRWRQLCAELTEMRRKSTTLRQNNASSNCGDALKTSESLFSDAQRKTLPTSRERQSVEILSSRDASSECRDNSSSPQTKLYFVKCDVTDAYGSIVHVKLRQLLRDRLRELPDRLVLRKYTLVKSDRAESAVRVQHRVLLSDGCSPWRTFPCNSVVYTVADDHQTTIYPASLIPIVEKYSLDLMWNVNGSSGSRKRRKTFVVKQGVPQGGCMFSSSLCELYYGSMSERYLSELIDHRQPVEMFVRSVDDYLFVTTDHSRAHRFLSIMESGIPEYNCRVNPGKTLSNIGSCRREHSFDNSEESSQVLVSASTDANSSVMTSVTYSGITFDIDRLQVTPDLSTYTDTDVACTVRIDDTRHPGRFVRSKMLRLCTQRMKPMFFDASYNDRRTMMTIVHRLATINAMRFHSLVDTVLTPTQRTPTTGKAARLKFATRENKRESTASVRKRVVYPTDAEMSHGREVAANVPWQGLQKPHETIAERERRTAAVACDDRVDRNRSFLLDVIEQCSIRMWMRYRSICKAHKIQPLIRSVEVEWLCLHAFRWLLCHRSGRYGSLLRALKRLLSGCRLRIARIGTPFTPRRQNLSHRTTFGDDVGRGGALPTTVLFTSLHPLPQQQMPSDYDAATESTTHASATERSGISEPITDALNSELNDEHGKLSLNGNNNRLGSRKTLEFVKPITTCFSAVRNGVDGRNSSATNITSVRPSNGDRPRWMLKRDGAIDGASALNGRRMLTELNDVVAGNVLWARSIVRQKPN